MSRNNCCCWKCFPKIVPFEKGVTLKGYDLRHELGRFSGVKGWHGEYSEIKIEKAKKRETRYSLLGIREAERNDESETEVNPEEGQKSLQ